MHIDVKRIFGLTVAAGLLTFGVATSPATAAETESRPLVEVIEELSGPDRFFVSPDNNTVFVFNSWGEGSTIDANTRQVTGSFPAIENMSHLMAQTTHAQGSTYPVPTYDGYALFHLDTRTHEQFAVDPLPGEPYAPYLTHIVANTEGAISAVTENGEYLTLDGTTVTSSKRIRSEGGWPSFVGVSADGSLYFETYFDENPPYLSIINVIDMDSGDTIATIREGAEGQFNPLGFDASGGSLWGSYYDDPETLVNIAIPSGEELGRTEIGPNSFGIVLADSQANWFIASGSPTPGGGLGPNAEIGARDAGCCLTGMYRLPDNGDVIYYDVEMRRLGFITAPSIIHPEDSDVTRLGDTVTFTADAEGLAITGDEPGAVEDAPHGSIWQSSADGETWTDMTGETGSQLTLTASAETFPLQYRRHFLDPFWGETPSSEPAQMRGPAPEITRADDLPTAEIGTAYPDEVITATTIGELAWSLEAPTTRAVVTGLPAGLSLDADTGTISGTPTETGEFEFTVKVEDFIGADAKVFHMQVTEDAVVPPKPDPKPDPDPIPKPVDPTKPSPLANTGGPNWVPLAGFAALLVVAGATGMLVRRKSGSA